MSRRNASVSSSASVSECDEDDEVERAVKKRIDKGKAREVEDTEKTQAKDIDQEDAYEWIIMDFCDDNGTCVAEFFYWAFDFFYPSMYHIVHRIFRLHANF